MSSCAAESEVDITGVVAAEEDDEVDAKTTDGWHIFGRECPKEEIVFLCQVIILYTVIVVSIYNLTVAHDDSTLWTALLSSSLGYLLGVWPHRDTLSARLVQCSKRQIDGGTRQQNGNGRVLRRRILRQRQDARQDAQR